MLRVYTITVAKQCKLTHIITSVALHYTAKLLFIIKLCSISLSTSDHKSKLGSLGPCADPNFQTKLNFNHTFKLKSLVWKYEENTKTKINHFIMRTKLTLMIKVIIFILKKQCLLKKTELTTYENLITTELASNLFLLAVGGSQDNTDNRFILKQQLKFRSHKLS